MFETYMTTLVWLSRAGRRLVRAIVCTRNRERGVGRLEQFCSVLRGVIVGGEHGDGAGCPSVGWLRRQAGAVYKTAKIVSID